jgi:hypothetical protein
VTTTLDRAEINRRNASKSTGPRTPEGKARSRFNAVKHGCRAKLPVLPGEDPEAYERRLDAWVDKFGPRDAVEHYLVERAVHVSWQLDRADRAEVARLAEEVDEEAARLSEDIARLGAELFRVPAVAGAGNAEADPDASLLSWPFDPEHPRHPSRVVAVLEATSAGCDWLLARWAALAKLLDEGRNWHSTDRLRAIRLLGKQPLDVIADPQLLTIYLACHAIDPDGPDVFAEPLGDLHRPEHEAARQRLSARFAAARAERAPRDASAGWAALRAIVTAAIARAETLREVRAAAEADEPADISARLSYNARESVDWLRKHQVTCTRALFRTFDELRKVRRDFVDDPIADEPAGAPPAPDRPESPSRKASVGRQPAVFAPYVGFPDSGPTPAAHLGRNSGTGSEIVHVLPPCRVVEPPPVSPTVPAPVELETVDHDEARTATNEANALAGETPVATNEANRPTQAAFRALPAWSAAAPALLALLWSASVGAMGAGVGPDPSLKMQPEATKPEFRSPAVGAIESGPTTPRAARLLEWVQPTRSIGLPVSYTHAGGLDDVGKQVGQAGPPDPDRPDPK